MSAYKLQKLLYYIQAWSFAKRNRQAFHDEVRAWKDGPVVPVVQTRFQGWYFVHDVVPGPDELTQEDREFAYSVWMLYRKYDGDELSAKTHEEAPWCLAREGFKEGEYSDEPISVEAMRKECLDQMKETHTALAVLAEELSRE